MKFATTAGRQFPIVPVSIAVLIIVCLIDTAVRAETYIRYATSVADVTGWNYESNATGQPNNIRAGGPTGSTAFLTATDFEDFTLPAGHVITDVNVGVYAHFDDSVSGAIVLRSSLATGTRLDISGGPNWRRLNIKDQKPTGWTQMDINALQVSVRRDSTTTPNKTLWCDAFRIVIDTCQVSNWYRDADADGYGDPSQLRQECSQPTGYVANAGDCNDFNYWVNPAATEVCNGIDDNCNGQTDEGVKNTYYRDADSDGYGNAAVTTQACSAPPGYVSNNTDCNDSSWAVRPGAAESCNGIDDNCNGQTDEGVTTTYYRDADGDRYGNPAVTTQACAPPSGYVSNSTDCNEGNASIYPGATETCNGIDDDCDGQVDEGEGAPRISNLRTGRAYCTIQSAIDNAVEGDEIVVAPGTYSGPGNRDIEFRGKAITVRGTRPEDAAVVATTVINCGGSATEFHRGFWFRSGETRSSQIWGVTITNGWAGCGGGVYCQDSSPTIRSCRIVGNRTRAGSITADPSLVDGGNGGGICLLRSSAAIVGCTIAQNSTGEGAPSEIWENGGVESSTPAGKGGSGGGVFGDQASAPWIQDCDIHDNTTGKGGDGSLWFMEHGGRSGGDGAGVCCASSHIEACRFLANRAGIGGYAEYHTERGGDGGAIYVSAGLASIINCVISGNSTGSGGDSNGSAGDGGSGAGIHAAASAVVVLSGCQIGGNQTGDGGDQTGCYGGGRAGAAGCGAGVYGYNMSVDHCIFSGNVTGKGGIACGVDGGSGGHGAAVCCAPQGSADIVACEFEQNRCGLGGLDFLRPEEEQPLGRGQGPDLYSASAFVNLSECSLDGVAGIVAGSSRIDIHGDVTLVIGDPFTLAGSSILTGDGQVVVNPTAEFRLQDQAVVDLQGGGEITNHGLFHAKGSAQIRNARITVTRASFEGGVILDNNVITAEAGLPVGQFFIEEGASVTNNEIHADGDRYLDLNPALFAGEVLNNRLYVTITEGQGLTRGGLLECRGEDQSCHTLCPSGDYRLASVPPFDMSTWTIERLELQADPDQPADRLRGAKLNLTNRFNFQDTQRQDADMGEVLYVKKLVLGENTQLNTALQRMYYGSLEAGAGSEIVNIPLLGFSLGIIAMEDDQEFYTLPRVRRRFQIPLTEQSCACRGDCEPHMDPDFTQCRLGSVDRKDLCPGGMLVCPEEAKIGVMVMATRAENRLPVSSVAAKGMFAKASEENIVISFEYLFRQVTAGTKINVYLSDAANPGERIFRMAELRPPPNGRPGAVGSGSFGLFHGVFPRTGEAYDETTAAWVRYELNFVRGTYVELELVADQASDGTRSPGDASVWIDEFDPQVHCQTICATFDENSEVTYRDRLVLIDEIGQDVPFGKFCLDLSEDGFLDALDVARFDMIANTSFGLCPNRAVGACCMPDGSCQVETQGACAAAGGTYQGDSTVCEKSSCPAAAPPALETIKPASAARHRLEQPAADVLAILGQQSSRDSRDRIYTVSPSGSCRSEGLPITCGGSDCTKGAVRLTRDAVGNVYAVHGINGVLNATTGQPLIAPAAIPWNGRTLRVGLTDRQQGVGVPLSDAAFDPDDTGPEHVYVVPVRVEVPRTGPRPSYSYLAAARLRPTANGGFDPGDIVVFGLDPFDAGNQALYPCLSCTPSAEGATCRPDCDFSGMRELEVDATGRVYVAAATAYNQNNWVLAFDPAGNLSERAELSTDFTLGGIPAPRGLTAMLLSQANPGKLYLSASVGPANDLITRVYAYTITCGQPGLRWDGLVEIEQPEPEARSGTTCNGFTAAITALQENPITGTLYAVGYSAPRFESDNSLPEWVDRILTTPALAHIPAGWAWSGSTPDPAKRIRARKMAACTTCDLAWPTSALFIPAAGSVLPDADDDGVPDGQDLCPGTGVCIAVGADGCQLVDCGQITSFNASLTGDSQISVQVTSHLPGGSVLTIDSNGRRHYMVIDNQGGGYLALPRLDLVHTVTILECPSRSVVLSDGSPVPCWQISGLQLQCDRSQPADVRFRVHVESTLSQGTPLTIDVNGQQRAVTVDCSGEVSTEFLGPSGIQTVRIVQCPNLVAVEGCSSSPPADLNFDTFVNVEDLQRLAECANGSGIPLVGDCQLVDLDGDADGDQADFGILQRCWSEAVPANPRCSD